MIICKKCWKGTIVFYSNHNGASFADIQVPDKNAGGNGGKKMKKKHIIYAVLSILGILLIAVTCIKDYKEKRMVTYVVLNESIGYMESMKYYSKQVVKMLEDENIVNNKYDYIRNNIFSYIGCVCNIYNRMSETEKKQIQPPMQLNRFLSLISDNLYELEIRQFVTETDNEVLYRLFEALSEESIRADIQLESDLGNCIRINSSEKQYEQASDILIDYMKKIGEIFEKILV